MRIERDKISEIQNFWGENKLHRWPPAKLSGLALSDETKTFLSEVGIPKVKPFDEVIWFFEGFKDLIPLKTHYENLQIKNAVPSNVENSYVFTVECEEMACFSIRPNDEKVIYTNPEVAESVRYCNSSIEMFVYFLTEFYKTAAYTIKNELDEESELEVTMSMVEKLRNYDSEAFDAEDSFWNTVLLDSQ